jgi:hypothetical protein
MTLQRLFRGGTLLLLILCACDHENECDDGVSAGPGMCKPAPTAAIDAGAKDAGAKEADAGGKTEPASLGGECDTDSDCKSDGPFCARMPGSPKGYCTLRDCSTAEDKCPPGYGCFNLGLASVPAFCMKR